MLLLEDEHTTTEAPSEGFIITTTSIPPVQSTDCYHNGTRFMDGEIVTTEEPCEHCYCMRGDIVCAVQECGPPLEMHGNNCTARLPKEGECCPQVYDCSRKDGEAVAAEATTTEVLSDSSITEKAEGVTTLRTIVASTHKDSTDKLEEITTEPTAFTTERPDESENEIHDKDDEHLTVKPTKNYTSDSEKDQTTQGLDSRINWDSTTTSRVEGAITTNDGGSEAVTTILPEHVAQVTEAQIKQETPQTTAAPSETTDKATEGILNALYTTIKSVTFLTTLNAFVETEIPVTTTKSLTEDEIPIIENVIPGEGDCLVDGTSYANSSVVPPRSKCELSCSCLNSIIQCESVKCGPVPENIENCNIYHDPSECCLTYRCDDVVQTTTAYLEVKEMDVTQTASRLGEHPEGSTSPAVETSSESEVRPSDTTIPSIEKEAPSTTKPSEETKFDSSTEPQLSETTEGITDESSVTEAATRQEDVASVVTNKYSTGAEKILPAKTTQISSEPITEKVDSSNLPVETSTQGLKDQAKESNLGYTEKILEAHGPTDTTTLAPSVHITEEPLPVITDEPARKDVETEHITDKQTETTIKQGVTDVATEKLPEPTEEQVQSASEKQPVTHDHGTEPIASFTTENPADISSTPSQPKISLETGVTDTTEKTEEPTRGPAPSANEQTTVKISGLDHTPGVTDTPEFITEEVSKGEAPESSTEVEKKTEAPEFITQSVTAKELEHTDKGTESPELVTEAATEKQSLDLEHRIHVNTEKSSSDSEGKTKLPEEVVEEKVQISTDKSLEGEKKIPETSTKV